MRNILDRFPLEDVIAMARRKFTEDVTIDRIARDYNQMHQLKGAERLQPGALRKALRTVLSKHEVLRLNVTEARKARFDAMIAELCLGLTDKELEEAKRSTDQWLAEAEEASNDQSS